MYFKRLIYAPDIAMDSLELMDKKVKPIVLIIPITHLATIEIPKTNMLPSVIKSLKTTSKEIVAITENQVNHFAGNMLSLTNEAGEKFLVMPAAARASLSQEQLTQIDKYYTILSSSLDTIEALGGGSARCMMAEVFLPENKAR